MPRRLLNQLAHFEIITPKLEESATFFKDLMGMEEVTHQGDSVYLRCFAEYYHSSLVPCPAHCSCPGLTGRLFKFADKAHTVYGYGETIYTVYQDIKTGQLIAIPVELAKAVIPGASCYQVIIEVTTATPAS